MENRTSRFFSHSDHVIVYGVAAALRAFLAIELEVGGNCTTLTQVHSFEIGMWADLPKIISKRSDELRIINHFLGILQRRETFKNAFYSREATREAGN